MTWQFPLVARRAFDEAKERILELKTQVADLDKERKRLIDFVSLGITQRSIYGIIPEPIDAEEPEEEESTPKPTDEVPTQLQRDIEEYGHSARSVQRNAERRNLAKADAQEEEVQRLLSKLEHQGIQAAERNNGNR